MCTFGTTRIDFHIYVPDKNDNNSEIKLKSYETKVGGSVYNTTLLLSQSIKDVKYYTLFGDDELSKLVSSTLEENKINYEFVKQLDSKSPVTYIHVDNSGERFMYSYDGNLESNKILKKLQSNYDKYDIFYSSFYEITENNSEEFINTIKKFYNNGKITILDLCPLLYLVSKDNFKNILKYLTILSGTEDEYKWLLEHLGFKDYNELKKYFKIKKLYIKQGKRGASAIDESNEMISCGVVPVESKNLTGCGDAFNAGVVLGEVRGMLIDKILKLSTEYGRKLAELG